MNRVVIARELTPRGTGAVSVVEYSGAGAVEHVRRLAGDIEFEIGRARLVRVRFEEARDDSLADEALVVRTASERIEVHLHGSPTLVRAACAGFGATANASPSLEERALGLLERAPCEAAARILLDQAEGALRREFERMLTLDLVAARAAAADLAQRGVRARFALEPVRIVLAGPVNAGKSTLFNALAGVRRALVADEPGTTRDVLAADVMLGAWPARVFDTAGERDIETGAPGHSIEREGQRRARLARGAADLVLWLVPADAPIPMGVPADAVVVVTQADRAAHPPPGAIRALTEPGKARAHVAELFRARFELPIEPWSAGEAVPFEREQLRALEQAARGTGDPREMARGWIAAGRGLSAR